MLEDLKNWIIGKGHCSRCYRIVSKSEFKEDKYRKKPYNICKDCQIELKKSVRKPHASWDGMKFFRDKCVYCKSKRIKKIYTDPHDHTGDIWKCFRCRNRFYGYQLDDVYDRAMKHPRKRPRPTKNKSVAQLRCWLCNRVFRQDNYKFTQSGRCPSCGFFNYELLRYVSPKKNIS